MRVERIVIGTFLMIISTGVFAQQYMSMKPKRPIICYAKPGDEHTHVEANEKYKEWMRNPAGRTKTATFEVTYNGFPADAKAAFQKAVDIWETLITSSVPIRVSATWQPLGNGVLGSAIWGSVHANFDGAQQVNTWYPAALAEKMAKRELNDPSEFDIYANFNSNFNWYRELTGIPGPGQYDLITVVLHELGHGLGFVDSYAVQGSVGFVGVQGSGVPMIYDQQLENVSGQNLFHDFPSGTLDLGTQLISNNVHFNSPSVLAAHGSPARIYAPSPYDGGSSIAHLDESTFLSGGPNSLMTPQIGAIETIHDPGPIVLAAFSDMGWVFTYIQHTDLKDSENENGPFIVTAKITTESGPLGQPVLHYTTGGAETAINLVATGNPNEFQASIPGTGSPATYGYFISVTDNLNREYTRPGRLITTLQQEEQFFTIFTTGPDTEAPRLTHSPKAFILNTDTELEIKAIASDNLGLSEVKLQYFINDIAQPDIEMTSGDPDSLYSATIDLSSGLTIGDILKYRIVAVDNSSAQNSAINPATGYHEVNVTGLSPTQDSYFNNFNSASDDFFGDGFSVKTQAGFIDPAIHSTHPYSEGNGFPGNELNLIYQLKIPIRVKAEDATIRFDEIVLVEPGESGSVFGDDDFFDYVVVEGSKDGGVTWKPVADGYDSWSLTEWYLKYHSSLSGNNSIAVGDPSLYRTRTMNLLNEFSEGDEVVVRFRLFSDPFAAGWGWAIDNLRIQIDETPPLVLHDHIDYLLPGAESILLKANVTDASGIQDLSVEVQVNDQPAQTIDLLVVPGVEEYTLDLNIASLEVTDEIKYRLIAHDPRANEAVFPPTGFINVVFLSPATPQTQYTNNFNSPSSDFIGNFFSITKTPDFFDDAIHSDHFYLNGVGMDQTSSFSFILTKPIILNEDNPFLSFDEIAIVQGHSVGSDFGEPGFNDYVIVEGSDDGGVTWKPFADGYDAVGQPIWVSAFTNGSNGTSTLFKNKIINLLENGTFIAGDEVLVRFRLYVDAELNGWGWAIDNLSIQGSITGISETISESAFKVYPNPAKTEITVELNTEAKGSVSLTVLNIHGQALIMQNENYSGTSMKTTIDVSDLPEGLYLVKAETGGTTVTKKILKTAK